MDGGVLNRLPVVVARMSGIERLLAFVRVELGSPSSLKNTSSPLLSDPLGSIPRKE